MTETSNSASVPTTAAAEPAGQPNDASLPLDAALSRGDLNWVIDALEARRDELLERWTQAAAEQAFHRGRRERAVADDIPALYDALLAYLRRNAAPWQDAGAPLDDIEVLTAARSHARARADQGLQPNEIVVELRLLRREVWRALRMEVAEQAPHRDVISTELLVNDAIDGAIAVGLAALTARIEELREDFLVTTIHEVRQPITAIKGTAQFAERLLGRPELDRAQLAQALAQVSSHADRMNQLLETMAEASRAALGQLQLDYGRADLRQIAEEAVQALEIGVKGRVRVVIAGAAPLQGEWDSPRLRQVLINLLTNAVKYSPGGETVEVTIDGDESTARITVRDHGIGLNDDDHQLLFKRFIRMQGAIDAGIDGTGLGLYLSRQIIDAHGGRIWAESDGEGSGTTFSISLPRLRQGERAA